MNVQDFNTLVERRKTLIGKVLQKKADEYSKDNDRLYNFKRAAAFTRESPEKSLLGMLMKHVISVIDIIEEVERCHQLKGTSFDLPITSDSNVMISDCKFDITFIDEKLGDSINYLILLETLLHDDDHIKPKTE